MASPISQRAITNFFVRSTTGLHQRITQYLADKVIETEGELEHYLWMEIYQWMRTEDEGNPIFNYAAYKLHSQYYYQEKKTYPDLEIYLGDKPVVIIELKHYSEKIYDPAKMLKDVEKNSDRTSEDTDLITLLIFTHSMTPEHLAMELDKLNEKLIHPERNYIIPISK